MKRPYLNKAGFNKLAQSIKDYINRKITGYDKLGTASTKDFTTYVSPTQTEQLPISSSVYSAMTNMLRGAYHPAGSKTVAELTEDLLVKANLGNVYKITEDGVTTDLFIGGAGQTIKTGDNAIVLYASEDTYKFSLESGVVDLDAYQKKELTTAIEGANTVEDALSVLSSGKVSTDLVPSNASASNKLATESDNNFKYTDLGDPNLVVDANDLKKTGVYSVNAQGSHNFPFIGWNVLYVTRANNSASYVQQICIDIQGNMYKRIEFGANSWSSWQKLVTEANIVRKVVSKKITATMSTTLSTVYTFKASTTGMYRITACAQWNNGIPQEIKIGNSPSVTGNSYSVLTAVWMYPLNANRSVDIQVRYDGATSNDVYVVVERVD